MGLIIFLLALAVLSTVSITLLFYLCWFYDRRSFPEQAQLPDEPPLRLIPTVVGIIKEAASLTVLVFSYPLRLIHDASPVRSRHHGETPVILVHGYGGNSANFLFMQWRLKWRGWRRKIPMPASPRPSG